MDDRDFFRINPMATEKMRTINVVFADQEFEQLELVKMKSKTKNWRLFLLKLAGIKYNNVRK